MTDCYEDEDEVAWTSHIADHRHVREDLHLLVGYAVNLAKNLLLDESVPSRVYVPPLPFGNDGTNFRVGEQEQMAGVQSECRCEFEDDLLGGRRFRASSWLMYCADILIRLATSS